ncbi:hypothetical protein MIMGU_mgv1a018910mg [Erythranthe guttata]|uniref:Protein MIZU-KUSSEI 1 n=1 Tax=Erythranthe guttata TaxID=4155 RepID=A0A022QSU4_ERYGU|nr:hypothetical protein MIMGU_mgv1a018910mg [Erythranthe guttata]
MSYPTAASRGGTTTITTVDCQKQVHSWRLLRSIARLLLPTCNCTTSQENNQEASLLKKYKKYSSVSSSTTTTTTATITGTLFGGSIRFAFECKANNNINNNNNNNNNNDIDYYYSSSSSSSSPLLAMPLWTMYFNGKKIGFAVKKKPSTADNEVLKKIEKIGVGAGITRVEDDVMYLRGKFERFHGSANSESFHLIDNDDGNDNIGQELSFYFLRSYC